MLITQSVYPGYTSFPSRICYVNVYEQLGSPEVYFLKPFLQFELAITVPWQMAKPASFVAWSVLKLPGSSGPAVLVPQALGH